jgi:hypothetical protein
VGQAHDDDAVSGGALEDCLDVRHQDGGPCSHHRVRPATADPEETVLEAAAVADGGPAVRVPGQGAVGTVVPTADVGGADPDDAVTAVDLDAGEGPQVLGV